MFPSWLWIPLTLFAAVSQTIRNTAQRRLTAELGTLGAALVRFLYGFPFIALWLAGLLLLGDTAIPPPTASFVGWIALAATAQMAGTALLLRAMAERSFAIGLVYSKSEIIQVALFSAAFLGEPLSWWTMLAIATATAGVVLMSPRAATNARRSWADPAALYGLAAGASFATSITAYRGANLAMGIDAPFLIAALTLFWSQLAQTLMLGGWLAARKPTALMAVLRQWRISLFAGLTGALASGAGVAALALHAASQVRTLMLVEVVLAYLVSLRFFREAISRREIAGIVLVVVGVAIITLYGS